jgi:pyruvate/2-oxoglutarate dehydrogenase complex dihydrolipoamide dehydrogenase (E3) component
MDHVRRTRQRVYEEADAPSHIEKLGVEVIAGNARFEDPHTIEIQETSGVSRRLTSRFFIIATGSRPRTGHFAEPPLTNETIFDLERQPKRLVIMGAGPVGIEMAQAFQRLGSEVTVVVSGQRILPRDDPEHAGQLQECLSREGVSFLFGQKVTQVERREDGVAPVLDNGRTICCEAVFAAMGREPAIHGLQLEKAAVRFSEKGIYVDRHCRTSQRHIYATGDVTGKFQFTHMSEHMSKVAVTNAILHWGKALDAKHVVWSTFTEPELAHLGQSEQQLRDQGQKYVPFRFPFAKLDRARTESETEGEVKVFADGRGRILGASILGANGGEMISEYALAMRHGLGLSQIADTIHPYPTYMLGNRQTADRFIANRLDSPLLAVLGKLLRYRGQRRGSGVL